MLAKKHRLNLSLEKNSSIFVKGSSFFIGSEFFLAYLRPNETELQVSCLTPKAALSKAVLRNHYRRFMYLLVEEQIESSILSLSLKLDLVIVLKRNFSEDKEVLKKDFSTLVEKIKNKVDSWSEQRV